MNHPCHDSQVNRLRKIEGQVRGLQKMIEERRYCMDIVSQLRAVQGALKKVELGILETHLQHCVQDALNSRNSEDAEAKIQEILQLLQKKLNLHSRIYLEPLLFFPSLLEIFSEDLLKGIDIP